MTSKRQPSQREPKGKRCFVYITLPGAVEPVTAARFDLTGDIGQLVYGRSYLTRNDAVEIDPVELKLAGTRFETARLGGVFGALRDASPDYWGRLVIERALGKARLDEVDYLLQSADDRVGALGFGLNEKPPAPKRNFNRTLDLRTLQDTALALIKGDAKHTDATAQQVKKLALLGTSMGGARPKAVVEDDRGLWMAKFNKPDDRWNNARVEQAMLKLAQLCGITAADSRVEKVGTRDVLLVKRFDRDKTRKGYLRARMVSALTLLRADDTPQARSNWSYPTLAEELRRICVNPRATAVELFRRMCFNALISNTDDHPRNHAVIAWDRGWSLSPAYDLTPGPAVGMERDLALIVGAFGRSATAENLITESGRFLLAKEEAARIVEAMADIVRGQWYKIARAAKVTARDCETIRSALENDGFRFRTSVSARP